MVTTQPRIAVIDYSKGNLRSVQKALALADADAWISDDPAQIARADALVLPGVGSFADASATMIANGQMQVIRERVQAGVPFLGICLGMQLLLERGDEGVPQMSDESAEETVWAPGLGLLAGYCCRVAATDQQGRSHKVPHVGWNQVCYRDYKDYKDYENCENDKAYKNCAANSDDRLCENYCHSERSEESNGKYADRSRLGYKKLQHERGNTGIFTQSDDPLFAGIEDQSNFYFTHSYQAMPEDSRVCIAYTTHAQNFACAVHREQIFATQFHPEKSSHKGLLMMKNFVDFVRKG